MDGAKDSDTGIEGANGINKAEYRDTNIASTNGADKADGVNRTKNSDTGITA